MYKLWFDVETGGTDENKHSLLTAYFALTDDDLNIFDDLYLQLKPDDISQLVVEPQSIEVHKIQPEEHIKDPNTITYSEGKKVLLDFLTKHKIPKKKRHFQPCGHNVGFDINFVTAQLVPHNEWEKLVHYRKLDTSAITSFLKDVEFLPADVGNLSSLVEYFKIPMLTAHNARDDIKMNIEVYRHIKQLMKIKRTDIANASTNSLLEIIEE